MLREPLIKGFDYNESSFYKKSYYDGRIFVVENATDYTQRSEMISLLVYQANSTTLPGTLLSIINITRRWPGWDIKSNPANQSYDIYYTQLNGMNQTRLCLTRIASSGNNNYSVTTTQSEDFGRSCQPASSISIEITPRFVNLKCNDLHVYSRDSLRIVAITKFPEVERTLTVELGQ